MEGLGPHLYRKKAMSTNGNRREPLRIGVGTGGLARGGAIGGGHSSRENRGIALDSHNHFLCLHEAYRFPTR